MIMGMEQADSGKIQAGETIVFGYFSQEPLRVADDKRVIDVVKDIAEFIPMADGSKAQCFSTADQIPLRTGNTVHFCNQTEWRRRAGCS